MPTINVGPSSDVDLQAIADTIGRSKKVLVVTGAGISTNCGIPDFRSENGLYSMIQAQYDAALLNPPWEKDRDEYDIDDRPMKKRKRWFYEVVRADGTVVDVIDADVSTAEAASNEMSPKTSRAQSPRLKKPSTEAKDCSSPLSSVGTSILDPPSGLQSPASSIASTRSQSPAESTISQSPPLSSQTSQSGGESSQSSRPDLPNLKGRDLFDSMVWKDSFTTSIFYMFISSLKLKISQDVKETTSTHKLIRAFEEGGRLLRNYTQNIDSLEQREEMSTDLALGQGSRSRFYAKVQREPRPKHIGRDSHHYGGVSVVQLHGSLERLRCTLCSKLADWDQPRLDATLAGTAPECPACLSYTTERTGRGRRGLAVGTLRPDIVLYGEEHPHANLVGNLVEHDIKICPDVLLILGTSLKVHGLKRVIKEFANAVHAKGGKVIFVNHTKPPESTWGDVIDYWIGWDCDAWVLDLKTRRPDIWYRQGDSRIPKEPKTAKISRENSRTEPEEADDEECGVFQTFKILDLLARYRDANGRMAPRALRLPINSSNQAVERPSNKRKSVPTTVPVSTTIKHPEKPVSATSRHQVCQRISYPRVLEVNERNAAHHLTTEISKYLRNVKTGVQRQPQSEKKSPNLVRDWSECRHPHLPLSIREWVSNLRKEAPSLGEKPPQIGRISFDELRKSAPPYIKMWVADYPDKYRETVSSYITNLASYAKPSTSSTQPPSNQEILPQILPQTLPQAPKVPQSLATPLVYLSPYSQTTPPIDQNKIEELRYPSQPLRMPDTNDRKGSAQTTAPIVKQLKLPPMASFPIQPSCSISVSQRRKTLSDIPSYNSKVAEQSSRSTSISRTRPRHSENAALLQESYKGKPSDAKSVSNKAALPRQTGACTFCCKKKIRCRKNVQCEYVKIGTAGSPTNLDMAKGSFSTSSGTVAYMASPCKEVSGPCCVEEEKTSKYTTEAADLFKPRPKPVERKIVHAYGTRGSQRWSIIDSQMTVDDSVTMTSPAASVDSSKDIFYDAEDTTADAKMPRVELE